MIEATSNMGFHWNFDSLKLEINAIVPDDAVAEFEIMAVMDCIDRSRDVGHISAGEAQCLMLMLCDVHTKRTRRP